MRDLHEGERKDQFARTLAMATAHRDEVAAEQKADSKGMLGSLSLGSQRQKTKTADRQESSSKGGGDSEL